MTMDKTAVPSTNLQAILCMCLGVVLLVVNDAITKTLVARFDPFQILFLRSVVALPCVAALAMWSVGGIAGLRSFRPSVHFLRAVLAVAATYLFIRSLAALPLAEATALIFTTPIFVAALSAPILGQKVRGLRLIAVGCGFLGAIIAVQPGAETMQFASLLALGAALLNALVMMSARWIDDRDGFWTMTFYMTLVMAALCGFTLATDWPVMNSVDAAYFAAMAVAGTIGIALITYAFRIGEAAAVAPFDYTALIWASVFGWLVWGNVPGWPVYLGAVIIVVGGILLITLDARARGDTP